MNKQPPKEAGNLGFNRSSPKLTEDLLSFKLGKGEIPNNIQVVKHSKSKRKQVVINFSFDRMKKGGI